MERCVFFKCELEEGQAQGPDPFLEPFVQGDGYCKECNDNIVRPVRFYLQRKRAGKQAKLVVRTRVVDLDLYVESIPLSQSK